MRKILNKKGLSLVELMVVVMIMGVLLCIAVPSYRSYKIKADNEACANNIEIIKLAVVDYYTAQQTAPDEIDDLVPFLEDGELPLCKKQWMGDGATKYKYGVATEKNADGSWTAIVVCGCNDEDHTPEGEDTSFPTSASAGTCYILQEAGTVTTTE